MRRIHRPDQIPTFTLDLGEGDWVSMKTQFTLSDREAINGSIVDGMISDNGEGGMGLGRLNLGGANTATLLRGIVEWGGPGFCVIEHTVEGEGDNLKITPPHNTDDGKTKCKVLNVSAENIRNLGDSTGRALLNEIERRNPQVSAEAVAPLVNGRSAS